MGLRDKIIMAHVKNIMQTILMVVGCIVIVSTILYFYTDHQIKNDYNNFVKLIYEQMATQVYYQTGVLL